MGIAFSTNELNAESLPLNLLLVGCGLSGTLEGDGHTNWRDYRATGKEDDMRGTGGGPKPKPTHLKLITGTSRKRRLNIAEPRPPVLLPDPPPELSEDALGEWERVSRRLLAAGILTVIDRATLAAYCQSYGRWVQAEQALAEMAKDDQTTAGLVTITTNGNAIQNALVGIARRAMSDMVRYAAEFGMTPSSRSRVRANLNGQTDPGEQFFDP